MKRIPLSEKQLMRYARVGVPEGPMNSSSVNDRLPLKSVSTTPRVYWIITQISSPYFHCSPLVHRGYSRLVFRPFVDNRTLQRAQPAACRPFQESRIDSHRHRMEWRLPTAEISRKIIISKRSTTSATASALSVPFSYSTHWRCASDESPILTPPVFTNDAFGTVISRRCHREITTLWNSRVL